MAFLNDVELAVYTARANDYVAKDREASLSKMQLVLELRGMIVEGFARRGIQSWDKEAWARVEKIPELRKAGIASGYDELMVAFINGCPDALAELNDCLGRQITQCVTSEYRDYVKEVSRRKNSKKETPWESKGGIKTMSNVLSAQFAELGFEQRKPADKKGEGAAEIAESWAKKKYELDVLVAALKLYANSIGQFIPADVLVGVEPEQVLEAGEAWVAANPQPNERLTLAVA